jgi:hypothetical protein
MGVWGLCFFMVGYVRVRKELYCLVSQIHSADVLYPHPSTAAHCSNEGGWVVSCAYRVAALCSLVWQNKNLSSLRP